MFFLWECMLSPDRAISEEVVPLKEYIEENYIIMPDIEIDYFEVSSNNIDVRRNGERIGTITEVKKI